MLNPFPWKSLDDGVLFNVELCEWFDEHQDKTPGGSAIHTLVDHAPAGRFV
jgi:hypothetical protein